MKKRFMLACLLVGMSFSSAQVLITDGDSNQEPHPSAILDLNSDSKALILSRLAAAPADPVDGMIFYDTFESCLKMYSNSTWVNIAGECEAPIVRTISFDEATATFARAAGTGSVSISYQNTGAESFPVAITASNTPYNLQAPSPITIPSGSGQLNYNFTWDTTPVSYDDVTLTLTLGEGANHIVEENASITVTIEGDEVPEPVNLVQNPNFDVPGNQFANWTLRGSGQLRVEGPETGMNAVRLPSTGNSFRGVSQAVPVVAGETYQVTFWYRVVSGADISNGPAQAWFQWNNASGANAGGNLGILRGKLPTVYEWTQITQTITAPDGATTLVIDVRSQVNTNNPITTTDYAGFEVLHVIQ